jgi:hypothetical protein
MMLAWLQSTARDLGEVVRLGLYLGATVWRGRIEAMGLRAFRDAGGAPRATWMAIPQR